MVALENRIEEATEALVALTPDPGRGKRQIRTEAELIEKVEKILADFDVADYLHYTFERFESVTTGYIGPGRGGANRKTRQKSTVRYQITQVTRDEEAITAALCSMGWKLYATNQPEVDLPLGEAVGLYRAAPRIERHFHLLKDAPIGLSPMYVRNDDQIKGLCRLLSLCVRLMTLIEIVIRRHLAQQGERLTGLYEANPNRETQTPTAVRILRAFQGINRVRLGDKHPPYTTPLTGLQRQLLSMLSLSESIYQTPDLTPNASKAFGRRCGQLLAEVSQVIFRLLKGP